MYPHVRATVSGVWRTVDIYNREGLKIGEKMLVVAQETSRWCINNQPVDVHPGLAVTFYNEADAQYFVDRGRAALVAVEPEYIVQFAEAADAEFFILRGVAQRMGQREVEQILAAQQAAYEEMERATNAEAENGEQDGETPEGKQKRRGRPRKAT